MQKFEAKMWKLQYFLWHKGVPAYLNDSTFSNINAPLIRTSRNFNNIHGFSLSFIPSN